MEFYHACSVSKIRCVELTFRTQDHSKDFHYFVVNVEKLLAVYFNNIILFQHVETGIHHRISLKDYYLRIGTRTHKRHRLQ